MGGAPPLPHNFAPQAPKRWSFFTFFRGAEDPMGIRGYSDPDRRETEAIAPGTAGVEAHLGFRGQYPPWVR